MQTTTRFLGKADATVFLACALIQQDKSLSADGFPRVALLVHKATIERLGGRVEFVGAGGRIVYTSKAEPAMPPLAMHHVPAHA